MKILENLEAADLAVYLRKEKTLVISDLHLGYEKDLQTKGILVPPFQFKEIKQKLVKIFEKTGKLKYVVINGDLKHEFGRISNQEWKEILELIDFLSENCEKIVTVKGNHDIILDRITKKRKVQFEKTGFAIGEFYITHGHVIPDNKEIKKAKTVVIGNEHPAVSLTDGIISEKYKCFLKGSWKRKNLVVQPSFCLMTEGTDILRGDVISDFLEEVNLNTFEVFVVAPSFDEIKYFGKIKGLEKPQK
ncbi:TPA: metallophosphoesterase [archaeon]|nr:metallophosphoesterase [Candidatus Naiadarchaeales archaeon SRR2090153.bin461]HIK02743.1 metallophosphoesterase [Candidatus Naiadarchaeales archaeon SRR2090159.bin1288]